MTDEEFAKLLEVLITLAHIGSDSAAARLKQELIRAYKERGKCQTHG